MEATSNAGGRAAVWASSPAAASAIRLAPAKAYVMLSISLGFCWEVRPSDAPAGAGAHQ
jgi:hypothetical protein